MALILFALLVRVRDGLPLSSSTDFLHDGELQERKQQLKVISKALTSLPERGMVKGHQLHIYFLLSEGVAYLAVCAARLPAALAFCFLEDLHWQFTTCTDYGNITMATRPYPFVEFDAVIQRLKEQYNESRAPSLDVTLEVVGEELRVSPPPAISMDLLSITNGAANGDTGRGPAAGQTARLEPVSAAGILSLVLNIMCAALNLIRGVHLIENTFQDDSEGVWNVVAFLLAFVCCVYQCLLYLFHSGWRAVKALVLLTLVTLSNGYLLGLRNTWQLLFHIAVATLSTLLTVNRRLQDRSGDCSV